MKRIEIDGLSLVLAAPAAGSGRICYLLVPMDMERETADVWAEKYGICLVLVCGMDWNDSMTPWAAPGVAHGNGNFGGHAGDFLKRLCSGIIPRIEGPDGFGFKEPPRRFIAGVSLSGMFALWAWLSCDMFFGFGSISGSYWYDGFIQWFRQQDIGKKRGFAYFSVGEKEGKAGSRRFSTVQENTAEIAETLRSAGMLTFFETTSGSHFAPFGPRAEKFLSCLAGFRFIRVVAAVIREGDRIFATQRGYGEFKDMWEFPGGKIEPGEEAVHALKREIMEELDTEVSADSFLCTVDYDYPAFHITLDCYMCSVVSGKLVLKEHESARWLSAQELDSVDWLPADTEVINLLRSVLRNP